MRVQIPAPVQHAAQVERFAVEQDSGSIYRNGAQPELGLHTMAERAVVINLGDKAVQMGMSRMPEEDALTSLPPSPKRRGGISSPLPLGEGLGVRSNLTPLSYAVREGLGVRANPKLMPPLRPRLKLSCVNRLPIRRMNCQLHLRRRRAAQRSLHGHAPVRLAAYMEVVQPHCARFKQGDRLPQSAESAAHIRQEPAQHLGHGIGRAAVFYNLQAQRVLASAQGVGDVPAETVPDSLMDANRRFVHESLRLVARAAAV